MPDREPRYAPDDITIAEQILYSTYRLEVRRADGTATVGTGFIYTFDDNLTVMITNRHVLEGCRSVYLRFHLGTERPDAGVVGATFEGLDEPDSGMLFHPDESIDLALFPIGGGISQIRSDGNEFWYVNVTDKDVPTAAEWDQFDVIEDVEMVGCPRGIFDQFNNLPIVRRGITATPLRKSFNGRDEFMVDMACFPGSSGSPIWIREKNPSNQNHGMRRTKLVGILYAGPTFDNAGRIVMGQLPSVQVATMMHLGQAVRSSALQALLDTSREFERKRGARHPDVSE